MKYRTRLILTYALLAFILSICMGAITSMRGISYENETQKNALRVGTQQIITQLEDRLDRMDSVMNYILSSPNLLSDITTLGMAEEISLSTSDIIRMENELKNGISTDFIYKNTYRTIFCNRDGELIGTTIGKATLMKDKTAEKVKSVKYLDDAELLLGKPLLVGPHTDPWAARNGMQVYSLVKAVRGHNMGYLEAQNLCTSLQTLEVSDIGMRFRILLQDGSLLYDSGTGLNDLTDLPEGAPAASLEYAKTAQDAPAASLEYAKTAQDAPAASLESTKVPPVAQNIFSNETVARQLSALGDGESVLADHLFLHAAVSPDYGFRVETIRPVDVQARQKLFFYSGLSSCAVFFFSLVMILWWSEHLMSPIKKLREVMEHTNLENLRDSLPKDSFSKENDELQALEQSYRTMTKRLDRAVQREQQSSVLQLQAQLDTLQAQVNPHFIYNVLNIISARGVLDDDENICEMCVALASMLQYSTSNVQRYATVDLELQYLQNYFYLMKSRYEDKFEAVIHIPEMVGEKIIPKMVLQQIVENSIAHAFEQTRGLMKVQLVGEDTQDYWAIKVKDNGSGFSKEKLSELQQKIEQMRETIDQRDQSIELQIGGMGLISTFARCYLLLGKQLIFTIENDESGSAQVTLGQWKKG